MEGRQIADQYMVRSDPGTTVSEKPVKTDHERGIVMTAEDILSAMNLADDAYILEAGIAGGLIPQYSGIERSPGLYRNRESGASRKSKAFPLWGAAAAALALILAAGAAWSLLRSPARSGASELSGGDPCLLASEPQPDLETDPAAFVWPADIPYPRTATLQWMEDVGIGQQTYYEMLKTPYYNGPEVDPQPAAAPDPALEQALLDLRIGGLYLGQPQEEVFALYGEPASGRAGTDLVYADGTRRDHWTYWFGPEQGLLLDFVDAGDGFILNQILCSADLDGETPLGIRVGQPFDEAEAAFAADPVLGPAMIRRDGTTERSRWGVLTTVVTDGETGEPGLLRFDVTYHEYDHNGEFDEDAAHRVGILCLGRLYPDTGLEPDPEQEEKNLRFSSGEISVWLPEGNGWQETLYREEEAKVLEMQFTIMEFEPWDYDGSAPIAMVDFRNGTAAAIFDEAEHGAIYRVTDRAAFERGLTEGEPLRGLELWEYVQLTPDTLRYVRDPYTISGDWDLNYGVEAPMDKLITTLKEKGLILFLSYDGRTVLFREKKRYVMAYAYGEDEKITGYACFFADHRMDYVAGTNVPLIELEDPAKLLGLRLEDVTALCGAPTFETNADGTACPGYLTFSGCVLVLHLDGGKVTSIDLYDREPTPTTIS